MSAMRRIISPCNSRNLRKTVLGVFSRVPGTSGGPFADDTASEEEEDESFRNSSLSARIATAGLIKRPLFRSSHRAFYLGMYVNIKHTD